MASPVTELLGVTYHMG